MLVRLSIQAEAGKAFHVAQRFAFVEGLTLREVGGEDRLEGTLRVPDGCNVADVIEGLAVQPAVARVSLEDEDR